MTVSKLKLLYTKIDFSKNRLQFNKSVSPLILNCIWIYPEKTVPCLNLIQWNIWKSDSTLVRFYYLILISILLLPLCQRKKLISTFNKFLVYYWLPLNLDISIILEPSLYVLVDPSIYLKKTNLDKMNVKMFPFLHLVPCLSTRKGRKN